MDSFYLTILSIAAIVLILALTYVGILLYGTTSTKVFPPTQNACPDYWQLDDSSGKCIFPADASAKNRGNVDVDATDKWEVTDTKLVPLTSLLTIDATNKKSMFDMTSSVWNNIYGKKSALCNKKYWANSNQISWDGVSNTNQC